MDWTGEEYSTVKLGDKRLNSRAKKILAQLSDNPEGSIPENCKSWSETKAIYRFFDNESVNAKKVFKPHRIATLNRIKKHPVVLLIQDTTSLNYSGHTKREDTGPLQQDNVRGIYLHPTFAMTPNRECLGVIDYEQWARKELAHQTKKERAASNYAKPLKEKESYRWLKGYKKANKLAEKVLATQFIYIADREADIYDIYHEAQVNYKSNSADWIIRATYNRSFYDENSPKKRNKFKELDNIVKPLGALSFEISATDKRKKRYVEQNIFAKEVTLICPATKKSELPSKVKLTVIRTREINPLKAEEPIEWILLTSLPVNNLIDAKKIIDLYLCRWQIETFFKILKSGCKIEKIRINSKNRFDPCLALYLVIAWRILYLTMLGRAHPNVNSEHVFEAVEWQTAYIILHKKKPPKKSPTLSEAIKTIAQLGGFLARKSDGEPGPEVMWKGLRSLHEYIRARETFEEVFDHTYG